MQNDTESPNQVKNTENATKQIVYCFIQEHEHYCVGVIEQKINENRVKLFRLTWHKYLPSSEKLIQFHQQLNDSNLNKPITCHQDIIDFWKKNITTYGNLNELDDMYLMDDPSNYGLPNHVWVSNSIIQSLTNHPMKQLTPAAKMQLNYADNSEDSVNITHFYDVLPRAAEYAEGYASDSNEETIVVKLEQKIQITSHGIGSGVYGIYNQALITETKQQKSCCNDQERTSQFKEFTIKHPFKIKDTAHATIYTNLSLALMRTAKKIALLTIRERKRAMDSQLKQCSEQQLIDPKVKKRIKQQIDANSAQRRKAVVSTYMEDNKDTIHQLTSGIKNLFAQGDYIIDDVTQQLQQCLENFNTKAKKSQCIPMPINYLMDQQGFDGILATKESNWDNFSRGCILFLNEPKKYDGEIHVQSRYSRILASNQSETPAKTLSSQGSSPASSSKFSPGSSQTSSSKFSSSCSSPTSSAKRRKTNNMFSTSSSSSSSSALFSTPLLRSSKGDPTAPPSISSDMNRLFLCTETSATTSPTSTRSMMVHETIESVVPDQNVSRVLNFDI